MIFASRTALAVAVTLCFCADVFGQAQGLKLQRSIAGPPPGTDQPLPAFVTADRLEGVPNVVVDAIGNAELRKGNTTVTGDRINYLIPEDEAEATGNVRVFVMGDEVSGPRLRLRVGDTTGIFESPTFRLAPRVQANSGKPTAMRGTARTLRFDGEEVYRVADASFTSCKPGQDDWFVNAGELDLDLQREVGTARRASLEFMGVSTPRVPWFNFSLNNERKTGFLPPTFSVQGKNGVELAAPFYWNIAPNYDATLTPRYMERRGLQALNQFRYLQPNASGEARLELLPQDKILGGKRWAYNWLNNYASGSWSSLININRVSDDNYFRDLSGRLSVATQVYLPREGSLNYSAPSGLWTATSRIQKWQTLQDPAAPVGLPYDRVPQLGFNYLKQVVGGFDAGLASEFVAFESDQQGVPLGRRFIAYPSLSWPFLRAGGYFTPKVGLHSTLYSLSNQPDPAAPRTQRRSLPIASVDSGLYFDRDTNYFGHDFQQTLEPRLYYLYVPFRDQSKIPVFDTSIADFNFAQIFSENYYSGPDRISDANQLTVAATSRLLNPSTGQEVLRGIFGQRYYFSEQRVALSGTPLRTNTNSPFLVGLAGRVAEHWSTEATVQYAVGSNNFDRGVQRANFGVRYSPELAKVLNLGYRYTAAGVITTEQIRQIDVSGQWPVGGGWYVVGRYNYDFVGRQANEVLAGVEYNAGCWIVRAVAQSFITATNRRTSVFFLQLELDGFSRLGSNPIEALRRNIPGYSQLNRAPTHRLDTAPFGGTPFDSGAAPPYGGTGRVPYDFYN